MAQQFCCQLEEDRLKQFKLDGGYHTSFSFNENYKMEYTGLWKQYFVKKSSVVPC